MNDYLQKYGNFSRSYIETVFPLEGYYDQYNINSMGLRSSTGVDIVKNRQLNCRHDEKRKVRSYQVILTPNNGFLNSNLPLLPNTELRLAFDRAPAETSLLKLQKDGVDLSKVVLELKNVVATTEYVSSPHLRNYFDKLTQRPIDYIYEEAEVNIKALPQNEVNIHIDNVRGGNIPDYVFLGIMPSTAIAGNFNECTTSFENSHVKEFNITLNGNSVTGYPVRIENGMPMWPYKKFVEATGRFMNNDCGQQLSLSDFKYNWLYAHKFEGEDTSSGWIGFNMQLAKPFNVPHSLDKCKL